MCVQCVCICVYEGLFQPKQLYDPMCIHIIYAYIFICVYVYFMPAYILYVYIM